MRGNGTIITVYLINIFYVKPTENVIVFYARWHSASRAAINSYVITKMMQKYYQTDLSKIHDQGFYEHSTKSFPFILSQIKKRHKSGLVVELGCGGGITAMKLIENNYSVLGIDYSSPMIKLAKKKVPKAKFIVASYNDINFPPCIAVLAIGEVFNYSFDIKTSYNSLRKIFQKIYSSLEENGIFIFDILEENQIKLNGMVRTFTKGKDWVVLTEKKENKRRKELVRTITTFYKQGKKFRKREEIHSAKLFNSDILKKILDEIGFNTTCFRSFGKYKLRDNQAVFVSIK